MSTDIAIAEPPSRALTDKPKRHEIGRKLQIAINAMIFEGKPMNEAARIAETSTRAIRKAMERPHVIAFMRRRKEVFRASVSAETIHHAAKIMRRGRNEMAKLKAMSFIEGIGDESGHSAGASRASPGLTIQIIAGPQPIVRAVETIDQPADDAE